MICQRPATKKMKDDFARLCLEADKRREEMSKVNENHHRCMHCSAYEDECQCDGGLGQ